MFMRKIFVVQSHPQNIFKIKLFPNYGTYTHAYTHIHTYTHIYTHKVHNLPINCMKKATGCYHQSNALIEHTEGIIIIQVYNVVIVLFLQCKQMIQ